jgi:hypothetical protein
MMQNNSTYSKSNQKTIQKDFIIGAPFLKLVWHNSIFYLLNPKCPSPPTNERTASSPSLLFNITVTVNLN